MYGLLAYTGVSITALIYGAVALIVAGSLLLKWALSHYRTTLRKDK